MSISTKDQFRVGKRRADYPNDQFNILLEHKIIQRRGDSLNYFNDAELFKVS